MLRSPSGGEGVALAPLRVGAQHLHGLSAAGERIGQLGGQNPRCGVLAPEGVGDAVDRVLAQRRRIFPPLAEHGLDVADGGPAHGELHVVPRRPGAVHGGHRLALAIAVVLRPVEAAVTQVDAAGEGDVEIPTAGVTEHDELLMVGPSRAHPHVA